jgi:hypothetical protein
MAKRAVAPETPMRSIGRLTCATEQHSRGEKARRIANSFCCNPDPWHDGSRDNR